MATRLLRGAVLGGTIVFLWGAVSWMVLPWHAATLRAFAKEDAMVDAIERSTLQSGVYFLPEPHGPRAQQPPKAPDESPGPSMLAAIRLTAADARSPWFSLGGLLIAMLGALAMGAFLSTTVPGLAYWARVRTIVLVAFLAGLLTRVPDWHWWGFSGDYTLLGLLDLVIGWFLGGLVIARAVHQDHG